MDQEKLAAARRKLRAMSLPETPKLILTDDQAETAVASGLVEGKDFYLMMTEPREGNTG